MAVLDTNATRGGGTVRSGQGGSLRRSVAKDSERLPLPVKLFLFSIFFLPLKFYLGGLVLSPDRLLLLVMVVPCFIMLISGRVGRLWLVDVLVILSVFWAVLSVLVQHGTGAIPFVGSTGVEMVGGYLLGRCFVRSTAQFMAFIRFFATLVLCALPLAALEAITGVAPLIRLVDAMPFFFPHEVWGSALRFGMQRAQVGMPTAIHFGILCSMAFGLTVVGFRGVWGGMRRTIMGAGISLATFFSLSSGALLALFLQIGLLIWSRMTQRFRHPWHLMLGIGLALYIPLELFSSRDFLSVFLSYATLNPSTANWRQLIFTHGMENVWANPLFGLGLRDWVRPVWMYSASVDNFWLLTAMRYGIPAFAFLAVAWIGLFWKILSRKFEKGSLLYNLRMGWVFVALSVTFSVSTVALWGGPLAFYFCFFGLSVFFLNAEEPNAPSQDKAAEGAQSKPAGGARLGYTRFPGRRAARSRS